MSLPTPRVVYGEISAVDILAIGPHPDDIEIGAAGALLAWGAQGYRIGLADLTRGELGTKGDAETRIEESAEAAKRLGSEFRINLTLPDGAVAESEENRMGLVGVIREARPKWVLANLEEDLHPDHAAGARLVKAAFFLSRLPKYLPEIPAHSPSRLFYYLIHTQATPSFLVDIGAVLEKKLEVMRAYASQFVEPKLPEGYRHTGLHDYLANVRSLNEAWGVQGGVSAAEAFLAAKPLVLKDLPSS
jgi:bacillithiol biosynthesis deacetylase BshB1